MRKLAGSENSANIQSLIDFLWPTLVSLKVDIDFWRFLGGEGGLKNSSLQLILYLLSIIGSPWILSFQCVLNPLFAEEPILWPTFQSLYNIPFLYFALLYFTFQSLYIFSFFFRTKTSDLPVMLKPFFLSPILCVVQFHVWLFSAISVTRVLFMDPSFLQ